MNKISIPKPDYDSPLVKLIFELEHQRDRNVEGSTPPWLFFDLKEILQRLESLTSARIEGNRTTLLSVVENIIEGNEVTDNEELLELKNIEEAIHFIEDNVAESAINRSFICELHKMTTKDLKREGSKTPGQYRKENVKIEKSNHAPPDYTQIDNLMGELVDFINEDSEPHQHLLKIAIVHHRMAAIHPFDNGNGRTVRLITYAMLSKYGFIDDKGFRLLNPSAIFCIDRQEHYDMLERADTGTAEGLLDWCFFMLKGMSEEVKKIDKLLDRVFSEKNIILPALELSLEKKQINDNEYEVLRTGMKKYIFQAKDVQHIFPIGPSRAVQVSRLLARMKSQKLIMHHPNYKLKYVIKFSNNYLLRGVIQQMAEHKLLPVALES